MKLILATATIAALALTSPALALDCDAGMRPITHAGGETCIPSDPQRIVSLHDLSITLPLVEFGKTANIAGSHGRISSDGTQFIRAVKDIFGVDYHNSGIEFIGVFNAIDMEKVASLEPDLIIGRDRDLEVYANFAAIAPTVLIDLNTLDYFGRIEAIADIAGESAQYDQMFAAYEARVVEAQMLIPDANDITVSLAQPWPDDGNVDIQKHWYAFSEVISDIGFGQTEVYAAHMATTDKNRVSLSGENLTDIDADFIFSSFEVNFDGQRSPDAIREKFEMLVPGYCDFLKACQANQMIYIPRTPFYSGSFSSLNFALDQVLTHVAGRGFTKITE